jgi:DNA repair protein RecN (Recombination protein N)
VVAAPRLDVVLTELTISELGVISRCTIELAPGMTVFTGETGAGKTMVVTGLGLLLGARADSGLVPAGAGQAAVEGRLALDPGGRAALRAIEAGASIEDGELLVGRTVSSEGRSRAWVGGRAAPVALLAELGTELVARHGQADQLRLLRPAAQRAALDRFGGPELATALERYQQAYRRQREVAAALDDLTTRGRERAQEADLLRHGLAEIAAVEPVAGEDLALAEAIGRLAHAEALRGAAETAHAVIAGVDHDGASAALDALAGARRGLDAEAAHDPSLAELATRLAEAQYLLADLASDLAGYAAGIDADPAALAAARERRAALDRLLRKYGADVAEVLSWRVAAERRLAELDGDDESRDTLTGQLAAADAELAAAAAALTAARTCAADDLARAVTAELVGLAMPGAEIAVQLRPTGPGPHGCDEVELLLRPHAGAERRPISRAASGGELSRIMLALEVVLAAADPVPTYVFDEVDAGVGGRAAVEVGRRLSRLAAHSQVLAVTHLPQVAAFADRHYVVDKPTEGPVTVVRPVEGDDRLRELSRMLAGLSESPSGREHAEDLLAAASAVKAG